MDYPVCETERRGIFKISPDQMGTLLGLSDQENVAYMEFDWKTGCLMVGIQGGRMPEIFPGCAARVFRFPDGWEEYQKEISEIQEAKGG